MGSVDGVFIADSDEVSNSIGKEVYFGEILGKHSEVYGELEKDEIELVTDDEKVVSLFEQFDLSSGYNPLEYINEDEE